MLRNSKKMLKKLKMLGCTDNNRAVMCMQRGIVLRDTCSTVFHFRNSLYVVSCGCVSFYY
jgi:hypothetical protein